MHNPVGRVAYNKVMQQKSTRSPYTNMLAYKGDVPSGTIVSAFDMTVVDTCQAHLKL